MWPWRNPAKATFISDISYPLYFYRFARLVGLFYGRQKTNGSDQLRVGVRHFARVEHIHEGIAFQTEDIAKIEEMAAWLNTVEGFPGMVEAEEPGVANLSIYFCDQQELIERMGDNHYNSDGAVTFWYTNDIIYTEIICIRSDLDQTLRNSVILEEIYNGLGPVQDTDLRSESIIYSGFSQPQALHPIDRVIIQLLYHPSLSCGMDAAECEEAILALYY